MTVVNKQRTGTSTTRHYHISTLQENRTTNTKPKDSNYNNSLSESNFTNNKELVKNFNENFQKITLIKSIIKLLDDKLNFPTTKNQLIIKTNPK